MKTISILAILAIAIQGCSTSKSLSKSENKKSIVLFESNQNSDTAYVNVFSKNVSYSK